MNDYDALAMSVAVLGACLVAYAVRRAPQSPHMRVGKLILGSCCVLLGLLHFVEVKLLASSPAYASRDEFLKSDKAERYVLVGRFDENWPAAFVDEKVAIDGISFVRQDGTPHEYNGFDGYRLKVVRLRDEAGREPMIVLRSQFKH
jgi:hypothetical protein